MATRFVQMLRTLVLPLIVGSHLCSAQRVPDAAPSGRPNERAVEGGSRPVGLETNVPLQMLIQRLKGNWSLVETGKGYWIGYTDDHYCPVKNPGKQG